MPVGTDHRQTKRCRHCEEGNHGDSVYWNIQLDQDLLNTIISIYPQWFKGLKPRLGINMAQGGSASGTLPSVFVADSSAQHALFYPKSPPKAEVDESPLQKSMNRNKESLKVKLMLRRPINQLVAQGILPPDVGHVDPSLAERQRMLKKCRLVDSLNDQLSHRPGPLELIKKNILHTEEPIERAVKEGHIEFKATCEGQKIKPESPDETMIIDDDSQSSDTQSPRDGHLLYGCESIGSSSPSSTTSSSSSNIQNQSHTTTAPVLYEADLLRSCSSDMLETAAAQAGITAVVLAPTTSGISTIAPSPLSLGSSTSSLSPLSSVASPLSVSCTNGTVFSCSSPAFSSPTKPSLPAPLQQPAPGKEKHKKKSKSKIQQQKARTIKFHEYKGPPSAQKNSNSLNKFNSNAETSYELLLQQQQLFLQWQLEFKQKYPQILLPVTDQSPSSPSVISLSSPSPTPSMSSQPMDQTLDSAIPASDPPPPPPLPPSPPQALPPKTEASNTCANGKPLRNLEDMKVSDLKAELKKRNLRVSGAKTHLIQRLKPYAESDNINCGNNSTSNFVIPVSDDSVSDSSRSSPLSQFSQVSSEKIDNSAKSADVFLNQQCFDNCVNKAASSAESVHSNNSSHIESSDEDIIREQQRKIEDLQRQLLNSQLLLQQQRQQQQVRQQLQTFQPQQAVNAKANLAAFIQQQQLNHALAQQQQKLQKQIQQQQQQMEQVAMNSQNLTQKTSQKMPSIINGNIARNINNNIVIKPSSKNSQALNNGHNRPRSNSTVVLGEHPAATLLLNHVMKSEGQHQRTTSLPNFVGTFMQPQFVLSSEGSKQLVFSPETVILPDHLKLRNGFINGTILTSTINNSSGLKEVKPEVVRQNFTNNHPNHNHSVHPSQVSSHENLVTLHVPEKRENVVNCQQNDDISTLFKKEKVAAQNFNDVLDLLMNNGEFDPPETKMNVYSQGQPQHQLPPNQHLHQQPQQLQQMNQSNNNDDTMQIKTELANVSLDPSIPSEHLSLEELGISVDTFPMELNESESGSGNVQDNCKMNNTELMDIDNDWLDKLICSELEPSGVTNNQTPATASDMNGNTNGNEISDPLDLFTIDDNDFKIVADFNWDRIDFAT